MTTKKLETQTQLQMLDSILAAMEKSRDEALSLPCTPGQHVVFFADDALPFRERGNQIAMVGDRIYTTTRTIALNTAAKLQVEMDALDHANGNNPRKITAAPILDWAQKRAQYLTQLMAEWRIKREELGKQDAAPAAAGITLTANEVKALDAIVNSEYQDGDPVDHAVWTSYCNPFKTRRTFGGVIASLVKKGCVKTGGSSADANHAAGCDGTTLAITQAGFDALQAQVRK